MLIIWPITRKWLIYRLSVTFSINSPKNQVLRQKGYNNGRNEHNLKSNMFGKYCQWPADRRRMRTASATVSAGFGTRRSWRLGGVTKRLPRPSPHSSKGQRTRCGWTMRTCWWTRDFFERILGGGRGNRWIDLTSSSCVFTPSCFERLSKCWSFHCTIEDTECEASQGVPPGKEEWRKKLQFLSFTKSWDLFSI